MPGSQPDKARQHKLLMRFELFHQFTMSFFGIYYKYLWFVPSCAYSHPTPSWYFGGGGGSVDTFPYVSYICFYTHAQIPENYEHLKYFFPSFHKTLRKNMHTNSERRNCINGIRILLVKRNHFGYITILLLLSSSHPFSAPRYEDSTNEKKRKHLANWKWRKESGWNVIVRIEWWENRVVPQNNNDNNNKNKTRGANVNERTNETMEKGKQ